MIDNYCRSCLLFSGIHPQKPFNKYQFAFNVSLLTCMLLLATYKCYLDQNLKVVETYGLLYLAGVKYSMFILKRKKLQQMMKDMQHFWKVDDENQTIFALRFLKISIFCSQFLLISGVISYYSKPFLEKGSSIYNCYIPQSIPPALFYVFEYYFVLFAGSTFVGFNMFTCTLIILVVVQFKLMNLKIASFNFNDIESPNDFYKFKRDLKTIVEYQQFLMRFVEKLNDLLSTPLALQMLLAVTEICMNTYVFSISETLTDKIRTTVINACIVVESFTVYCLPSQLLIHESASTANMVYYECKWYLPVLQPLRRHFVIIIKRSQKSVSIRAGDYHIINNGTILTMLKTTYSFYTFLQNIANH